MADGNYKKIKNNSFPFNDYVLALPGWYPTWLDPLPGDFNQRHIRAASIFTPQIVLYVGKDVTGTLKKTEVRVNQLTDQVLEYIVVYPGTRTKLLDAVHSNLKFLLLLFKYSKIIRKQFGKPKLLHSYIVMRGGLAGWLLSKRWKRPFILTENWTIYYPADPGYLPTRNTVFKNLVGRIFKDVERFLPVTHNLQKQAASLVGSVPSTVVPNVVETNIFNLNETEKQRASFCFVHVSTMIYQKNPEGLLRVFKRFSQEHPDAFLQMVGPYPSSVLQYSKSVGLTESNIRFEGAVSYMEVATILKRANALVLFSRYENLPCVILEAFCCGVPVICTRVGGVEEVIEPSNGILIDSEDEEGLFKAMATIYKSNDYNSTEIAEKAKARFSYESIGRKIHEVYLKVAKLD